MKVEDIDKLKDEDFIWLFNKLLNIIFLILFLNIFF